MHRLLCWGFSICRGLILIDFSLNLQDFPSACEETLKDMYRNINQPLIKYVKCHLKMSSIFWGLNLLIYSFLMLIPSLIWHVNRLLLDWYIAIFSFVVSVMLNSCDDLLDTVYVPISILSSEVGDGCSWGLLVGTGEGHGVATRRLLRTWLVKSWYRQTTGHAKYGL